MTVIEMLEAEGIELDVIEDRGSISKLNYWKSCFEFLDDVQDKDYDSLSTGQSNWVDKIIKDMIEYTA